MNYIRKDFSWVHPTLVVRDARSGGQGLFATQHIRAGTTIAMLGGYVMTLGEEKNLPETIGDLAHQISDDLVIGIRHEEEIQVVDRINHSCEPNCGFHGQIKLVAMKDVGPGDEITFDYAMVLYSGPPEDYYELECHCGKEHCRKKITSEDWKNPDIQKKYTGYFQEYIEEKINSTQ